MWWLSIILALIGLTSICDAAPTGSSITIENYQSESTSTDTTTTTTSSSSSSSSPVSLPSARKLSTHDVGLPSELAWQAWLVVANKPDAQSSFESATVPRRISPKSVFIAPKFCSDGYTKDGMGRCIKDTIQIDYKSHLEFILGRLRVKFPSRVQLDDSAATSSEQKQSDASSGPLQVNISLGIEDNLSSSRSPLPSVKTERDVPGVDPLRAVRQPDSKTETTFTAYEVGNGTKTGKDEEGTFFRSNSSQPLKDHSIREVVVPIAEFVDDGNQTFTEVIDYKIPPSLGELFNDTRSKPLSMVKNITEIKPVEDSLQPTVVLLLSPTELNGPPSTPYFQDPDSRPETSNDHILVRTGSLLVNDTRIDEIPVNISELDSPSEDTIAEIDDETTLSDDGFEQTTTTGVPQTMTTTIYPEEDLDDTTEFNDEILSPGEAGMLVSAGKFGPSSHPEEVLRSSSPAWVFTSSKTAEESGGNISSESSISGDVILETTLLDLNIGTGSTTSKHMVRDDLRELFEAEEDHDLKPEVIFSSQEAHRLDRPSTRGKKRAEDLATSASTPKESSVIFNQDNSRSRETVPHNSRHKEDDGSSVRGHLQQRRRTTTSSQDYVRFPEDQRQVSSSYVLFPSDHSNSINGNLNSKDHSSFTDEGTRPQLKPKSSVSFHQKKTYWHLPPGWRIDDLQPPRQPSVPNQNGNQRHGQNPMLFRFWTRMPLFRDPSLTMSNQSSRISPIVSQQESTYRAISPEAVSRGFVQSTRGGQVIG